MKSKGKPRHIVATGFLYAVPMSLLAASAVQVGAQSTAAADTKDFSDFTELKIEDLLNKEVSVATKSRQRVSQAPGIVTVITAEEIRNMGARDLRDVLEMVPGFEFSRWRNGVLRVGVRGTKDPYTTSKILLLIDGIPYNSLMYGVAFNNGYEFNINAVERIEIIRGPGSALYGRNAFNGVISVITKKGTGNEGLKLSAQGGNYNTYSGEAAFGYSKNDTALYLNANRFKTDGHEPEFADGRGGVSPWETYQDNYYFNLKANVKNLELTSVYVDNCFGGSSGPFITNSQMHTKRGSHSLRFTPHIGEKWNFATTVLLQHGQEIQDIEIFKPGLPGIYGSIYPNGRYATPQHKEYKYGLNVETTHYFSQNHTMLMGLQMEKYGVTGCKIRANYDLYDPKSPALFFYDGNGIKHFYGKPDMPEDQRGWIAENGHDYSNIALFIQDTFNPVSTLGITIGGRYDHDSEFGDVFNPRGGLVWEFAKNADLKILYGQAYRAPDCQEQFKASGFTLGNPNLKPEKIKTFEIGVGYRMEKISFNMNLFYNKLTNVIYAEPLAVGKPNVYQNIGKNTAQGIEFETRYIPNRSIWLFVNYSYVDSQDNRPDSSGNDGKETAHFDIAPHKVNAGLNISFLKKINFNTTFMYRSKREKYPNVKDEIGPYALLNVTLLAKDLLKKTEFSLSIYNITNNKYYDQEAGSTNQPYQPGRSIVARISYLINQ